MVKRVWGMMWKSMNAIVVVFRYSNDLEQKKSSIRDQLK